MTHASEHTSVMNCFMELALLGGKSVGWLFSFGRALWHRFRYGSRLSLSLDWQRPLITVLGERSPPRWRAIELQATASRDETFVLAKGDLEARKLGSWKWTSVNWFGFSEVGLLYFSEENRIMKEQLTAVFQQVPEGYIAFVEELPGANTQGGTLEEARTNLQEAIQLVLESNRMLAEESLGGKIVIREPIASIS